MSLGIFIAYAEEHHWDLIEARLIAAGAVFKLYTIISMWSGDEDAGPFAAWVVCPNREEEDKVIEICNAPIEDRT